jgi:hypothetical protein
LVIETQFGATPDEYLKRGLGIKEQLNYGINAKSDDQSDVEPDLDEIYKKKSDTLFPKTNPLSRKNTARIGGKGKNRKRRQTKRQRQTKRRRR